MPTLFPKKEEEDPLADEIDRLPRCSYAVERDGEIVNVWLLYWLDADEIDDPVAESEPWVEVAGSNVLRWGEKFGGHLFRDSMKAENVPDHMQEREWKKAEAGLREFWEVETPAAKVHILNGVSVEEAREQADWPEEIMRLQ